MRNLVKQDRMSAVSMAVTVQAILLERLATRKPKEVWFMTKQYTAEEALAMNWINHSRSS